MSFPSRTRKVQEAGALPSRGHSRVGAHLSGADGRVGGVAGRAGLLLRPPRHAAPRGVRTTCDWRPGRAEDAPEGTPAVPESGARGARRKAEVNWKLDRPASGAILAGALFALTYAAGSPGYDIPAVPFLLHGPFPPPCGRRGHRAPRRLLGMDRRHGREPAPLLLDRAHHRRGGPARLAARGACGVPGFRVTGRLDLRRGGGRAAPRGPVRGSRSVGVPAGVGGARTRPDLPVLGIPVDAARVRPGGERDRCARRRTWRASTACRSSSSFAGRPCT